MQHHSVYTVLIFLIEGIGAIFLELKLIQDFYKKKAYLGQIFIYYNLSMYVTYQKLFLIFKIVYI